MKKIYILLNILIIFNFSLAESCEQYKNGCITYYNLNLKFFNKNYNKKK